jgi:hypothetical protein
MMIKTFPSFEATDLIVMTTWLDFFRAPAKEFEPLRRIAIVSAPPKRSSRQLGRQEPVIG